MATSYFALASYHIKDFGVQGLTHLALAEKYLYENLKAKCKIPGVKGLFYIQTCNRIEFLYSLDTNFALEENFSLVFPQITKRFYTEEKDIIEHLLSVCLSKDSMVFGESQILGQFRQAFQRSNEEGLLDRGLHRLLQLILTESKRIRTEHCFRHFPTSMSALAAKKIQHLVPATAKILFVGAGETNELVARYLLKKKFRDFFWLNRSAKKAENLAQQIGGQAIQWSQLSNHKYDVVVTATNAGEILFTEAKIAEIGAHLAVDLSVPANISVDRAKTKIEFFNVEDFQADIESVKKQSEAFLLQLNAEIATSTEKIQHEMRVDRAAPLIAQYHQTQLQIFEKYKQDLEITLENFDEKQKIITWFEKTFKDLSHKNLVEIKKALSHVTN